MTEPITITLRGPLFDGRAAQAAQEMSREIVERVAQHALEGVQRNLDTSLRHPTPYYETQINVRELAVAERQVNDRGVVYGPWLEGTSSRNQTTRFKGYASFRRARETTRRAVPDLAGAVIKRYRARMGG